MVINTSAILQHALDIMLTGWLHLTLVFFRIPCVYDKSSGAHTDCGLLTLVNQDDDICALEVQNRSGEWKNAKPIPGTFVCNIGDMLKIWSNGIYLPTLHRVVNNSPGYRVSVAFFYESNFDAAIEPIDFCEDRWCCEVRKGCVWEAFGSESADELCNVKLGIGETNL